MAKYIDADRLRKAVEKKYNDSDSTGDRWDLGYDSACEQILEVIDSLQQEQPEVDLNFQVFAKEMDAVFNLPKEVTENTEENPLNWEYAIARHFYELGCRRTAEKYDEIEHNRQRAEEQGGEGLEEEIERYLHFLGFGYGGWVDGMDDEDLRVLARHFAQWGAEHAKIESEKPVPADLEEAAENHIRKVVDTAGHPGWDWTTQDITDAFIAGAQWQKEKDDKNLSEKIAAAYQLGLADKEKQMMSEAIEAKVIESFNPVETIGQPTMHGCTIIYKDENKPYLVAGDKPRIIIVKED